MHTHTQRVQNQEHQLAALERELAKATHTITTLTDRLERVGQAGVINELEVKVQSLERELKMEIERRRKVCDFILGGCVCSV